MRPRYVKPTEKDIESAKDYRTVTTRGCDETTNPRGTPKQDNPLKGIRDPIPRNPYNPLKGIWDLVPNGIRIQWPRGLTVPT